MMDREQEDLILAQAERIKARRLQERRLEAFEKQTEVMIRWDNRGDRSMESYTSITVPAHVVAGIVRGHYHDLIEGVE